MSITNLAGVEVKEDDITTCCGQTCRLQFSQVLKSDHNPAAVLWKETVCCQRGFTDNLPKKNGEELKAYKKDALFKSQTEQV